MFFVTSTQDSDAKKCQVQTGCKNTQKNNNLTRQQAKLHPSDAIGCLSIGKITALSITTNFGDPEHNEHQSFAHHEKEHQWV